MRMVNVLDLVQDKLRAMNGLRSLIVLDQAQQDAVIEKEREAEETAERMGLMNVVNEGFWTTFGRDHQIALILGPDSDIVPTTNELLQLKDQDGKRIGEWTGGSPGSGQGRMMTATRGSFVMYEGVKINGEPFFVIPEIEFPYLEGVQGIHKVVSCSPSSQVDALLREWSGQRDDGIHSRIVGFDIDRDDIP